MARQVQEQPKGNKRFLLPRWIIVSVLIILCFIFILTSLIIILVQGIAQAANTLTIISIIFGVVVTFIGWVLHILRTRHAESDYPPSSRHDQQDSIISPPSAQVPSSNFTTHSAYKSLEAHSGEYIDNAPRIDWGEAPHTDLFYGRDRELTLLKQCILNDRSRVVAVLGPGGIGKSTLAAAFTRFVQDQFEIIFWRSLLNPPSPEEFLKDCLDFLEPYRSTGPSTFDEQIRDLITYLQRHRCLLILDNLEAILQEKHYTGAYRTSYEGYGRLLQRIGEAKHQSSLLLTSREKPREIVPLEGASLQARSIQLLGVGQREVQEILKEKNLGGSDEEWSRLVQLYSGNPLALKLISEPIREIFGGDIAKFLRQGDIVFGDIHDLLAQQIQRLPEWEREILYWLAIERVMTSLQDVRKNILHPLPKGALLEALNSLRRRSMIVSQSSEHFTLHPVVMEYIITEFTERIYKEILEESLEIFNDYPLLKAQSKDYVRNAQRRLILEPLANRLFITFGKLACERKFKNIVSQLQKSGTETPGYTVGNVINLLVQLQANLRGWDFSNLLVNQAYLRGVKLPYVNFSFADLATSVFTETFGSILSVDLSVDSQLLAAGTVTGEIRTWIVSSSTPALTFQGHTNWVWSVAFHPNGHMLASGSDDRTVRLWDVSSGKCLMVLNGHRDRVRSVVFSPDGQTLVSGSEDRTVRLWESRTGRCINTLESPGGQIYAVAFNPDGQTLASGSEDGIVRVWKVGTGQLLSSLRGHTNRIYSLAFSADGQTLASGSEDRTVRLWESRTGRCINTLESPGGQTYTVAFNPDGQTLASGSEDGSVRLWEISTGKILNSLREHTNRIYSLAFSADGKLLVSGSNDQTMKLWDVNSEQCLDTLQGYANLVWSVAFSPDGQLLVSGSNDQAVRLWNVQTGQCLDTFQGHSNLVRSVTFSPDGRTIASGSEDRSARLWDTSTGQCLRVLEGHRDRVRSVVFSPDGQLLASGSEDKTVRLWEVTTGRCLDILECPGGQTYAVAFSSDGQLLASGSEDGIVRLWETDTYRMHTELRGHLGKIYSLAFSPDGKILASGSNDQTVKLWEVSTDRCLATLSGHSNRIYAVAFSPDGKILASGSNDQTVKLWEVSTDRCLATLQEKSHWVYSIAFSPDGRILGNGSNNGTIELWDVQVSLHLKSLKSERPYEGMNITKVKGLTVAQRAMLQVLGAIEN